MGKKKRRHCLDGTRNCGNNYDLLSINDVANAERSSKSGRLPKNLRRPQKRISNAAISSGESAAAADSWLAADNPAEDDDDECDGAIAKETRTGNSSSRRKRRERKMAPAEGNEYNSYPFDFWVLLSDYILPEDVCRFSLICRDANRAISQASFWKKLYLDFYTPSAVMPNSLEPDCITRISKLRLCVIRSLFCTYDPFLQRLRDHRRTMGDPHTLKESICLRWWQERSGGSGNKEWMLFFQFEKRPSYSVRKLKKRSLPKDNWGELLPDSDGEEEDDCGDRDIFENPEEYRHVLQIYASSFSRVDPAVLGMKLLDVCLTVSVGQSLALRFIPAHQRTCQCDNFHTVNIGEVKTMRIYPWHYPRYADLCEGGA